MRQLTSYEVISNKELMTLFRTHAFAQGSMRMWLNDWENGTFLDEGIVIMAFKKKEFVGWLLYTKATFPANKSFCNIYVLPKYRRMKIGTRLLSAIRKQKQNNSIAIQPHNDISQSFFDETFVASRHYSAA